VRTGNYKSQYAHYVKAVWGKKENDKQKSLLAAGIASREPPIPLGGIGKMGPGRS
jgi:hypothetical protein